MRLVLKTGCLSLALLSIAFLAPKVESQARGDDLNTEITKLIREAASRESYDEAGAVILLLERTMSGEKSGLYNITAHIVGKILDEKAKSDYGQAVIPFNSYYQQATLDFARTIKKDGTVIEVSRDATQIKTDPNVKRYTDMRALTFSLPALERGAVFEFQVTINQKIPLMENNWAAIFGFYFDSVGARSIPRIDPVYRSRLILKVPEGEEFIYQVKNAKVLPTIKKESGHMVYTWEVKDLPTVTIEDFMPNIDEIVPLIQLSSIKEWKELDEWASSRFLSRTRMIR